MALSTVLDVALVAWLASHALRGWRTGGIISVLTMAGALGGGWLGLRYLPPYVQRWTGSPSSSIPAAVALVLGVVVCAWLGEGLLGGLARRLSSRARGPVSRRVDATIGAVARALVLCLLVTTLGSALKPVLPSRWSAVMNDSRVLPVMGEAVPDAAQRWATGLTRELSASGLPNAFSGLNPEPVIPVQAPDPSAGQSAGVKRAAASIVKITADAQSCNQVHEGSGWVVARHRVVTNAHVVAGASSVRLQVTGTGPALRATVVAFDPELDLAVLDVPTLTSAPLQQAGALARGTSTVVAGFPLDGGYTLRSARIRGTVAANGDDIYGAQGINRRVYSINGTVQPGNSGGPLLTTDGKVAGTVFARSVVDPSTGYVLTSQQTSAMIARGVRASAAVSTQACAKE